MYDLKSFSNEKIGTHFSLTGEVLILASWTVLDMTGTILEDTWILQEFADDELLFDDTDLLTWDDLPVIVPEVEVSTWVVPPVVAPAPAVVPPTPTTVVKPTTPVKKPTTPVKKPATNNDLNIFLDNFRR